MSLKIRLAHAGAKKRPFFKIVLADSRSPRDGKFLERLGSYDPMLPQEHKDRVVLNADRIKHWLGVGAQPSDRVVRFLVNAGMMAPPKRPEQPLQSMPRAERKKIEAEKAAAAPAKTGATPPAAAKGKEAAPAAPAA